MDLFIPLWTNILPSTPSLSSEFSKGPPSSGILRNPQASSGIDSGLGQTTASMFPPLSERSFLPRSPPTCLLLFQLVCPGFLFLHPLLPVLGREELGRKCEGVWRWRRGKVRPEAPGLWEPRELRPFNPDTLHFLGSGASGDHTLSSRAGGVASQVLDPSTCMSLAALNSHSSPGPFLG